MSAEQRRLANFVDCIGEGRGSQALAKALVETERRVGALTEEVDSLRRSHEKIFRPPPIEWIRERMRNVQSVLEQRTARSAQMLRNLLGPIKLELQTPDIARPFYCAVTTPDAVALIDEPPPGRRAVRIHCEGGRGRKEFEPPRQYRSSWRSSTRVHHPCTSRLPRRPATFVSLA